MWNFTGPAGILTFSALAVASLFVVAFALIRIATAKAEATLHPSTDASRSVRRWMVLAIASTALSIGAGALAVANYVWCVGEC